MTQLRKSQVPLDTECRPDFPALHQDVNSHPLVYLDNAASAQQPSTVIDAVAYYQRHDHANVHRGVHTLSYRATEAYEGARDKIQSFINAASRSEIVLTSGTTESINLVAQSFCRPRLTAGDKILITHLEHHANIVPWQLVCEQTGAELVVAPINDQGELNPRHVRPVTDGRRTSRRCRPCVQRAGNDSPGQRHHCQSQGPRHTGAPRWRTGRAAYAD